MAARNELEFRLFTDLLLDPDLAEPVRFYVRTTPVVKIDIRFQEFKPSNNALALERTHVSCYRHRSQEFISGLQEIYRYRWNSRFDR